MRTGTLSNQSVLRVKLDQRSRKARLQLEHIERLLTLAAAELSAAFSHASSQGVALRASSTLEARGVPANAIRTSDKAGVDQNGSQPAGQGARLHDSYRMPFANRSFVACLTNRRG
jgi:hypothetical protein